MATGDQDIVSLGIDISSFDTKKLSVLNQYISVFNDLAKFDGKIFNPVMGDGLAKFNTSIAETSRLIDEMNVKMATINTSGKTVSSSMSQAAESTTQLSAAMKQTLIETVQSLTVNQELLKSLQARKDVLSASTSLNAKEYQELTALDGQIKEVSSSIRQEEKASKDMSNEIIKQTKLTRDLTNELKLLKDAQKEQGIRTANAIITQGEEHPQTKSEIATYTDISANVNRVEKSLTDAKKSAGSFALGMNEAGVATQKFTVNAAGTKTPIEGIGTSLTSMLTKLRYLAFIIPGLGIAGIFNLAFEAIKGLASGFIDFDALFENGTDAMVRKDTEFYESLTALENKFKDIDDIISKVYDTSRVGLPGFVSEDDLKKQKEQIEQLKAEGIETGTVLQGEVKLAQIRKDRAEKGIFGGRSVEFTEEIGKQVNRLTELSIKINDADNAIRDRAILKTESGQSLSNFFGSFDKDRTEKYKKDLQSEYDEINNSLKVNTSDLKEYNDAINALSDSQLKLQKFNSDQTRKLLVETTKDNIDLNIDSQKVILGNDKKFYDDKKKAIEKEYQDEVRLAQINRISVTGTKENPNVSATAADVSIAINKENDDIAKATIRRNQDQERLDVEFYQRKIHALTESNKDELDADALHHERIFQNQEKDLSERINSFEQYILDKKAIIQKDHDLEIQSGAAKAGGLTNLLPEERAKIDQHRVTQEASLTANVEKQSYDIIYSYLSKIIKDKKDEIEQEDDLSKEGYTNALHNLNKSYEDRKISLEKYHTERKKIESTYQRQELDIEIQKNEDDLQSLIETNDEKIKAELVYLNQRLAIAEASGNQEDIDKAQGKSDAAEKAEVDLLKEIAALRKKIADLKLKREEIEPPDDKKWKEWVTQFVRVEEAANKAIKKLYDDRVKLQEDLLQRKTDLLDKEIDSERDAVDKSSLNAKDKQALDIQLAAQKNQLDEDTAVKERALKVKEFEFNKGLELANAAVGIAAAIIKDGLTTPKSIADAAIGAIQIFSILAARPPAYGEGIDFLPRTMFATYGEKGAEYVKQPGKQPFIALTETTSLLERGTQIIPLRNDFPVFDNRPKDESWAQTRFLAKQIKGSKQEIKNIFKPTIVVDMNFESRKRQILGN